jgi:hypothetical protein
MCEFILLLNTIYLWSYYIQYNKIKPVRRRGGRRHGFRPPPFILKFRGKKSKKV